MSTGDARQRVADAMRPKGRRAPTPPLPEPDDDPLADAGGQTDAADDVAIWKNDPHTRRQCLRFRLEYVTRTKQLIALALTSTDPRVAALAGQVQGLHASYVALGGKP